MKVILFFIIIITASCSQQKQVQEFDEQLEYDSTWEGNRV